MDTIRQITSADLFPFAEWLRLHGEKAEMRKENGNLDVLEFCGAKIRNLAKKNGSGFHIQGIEYVRTKAEHWLAAYHFASLLPTTKFSESILLD